jgi:type VI secretion system secreted protein VgrG
MSEEVATTLAALDCEFWTEADGPPWSVREVDIREELSGAHVARVELENDDPQADPAALLGAAATITLSRPTADPPLERRFSGVVRAVDEAWGTDRAGRRRCTVVIEPSFACLGEERLTRKFQGLTVPDVVRAVLGPWADEAKRTFELRLARESEPPSSGRGYGARDLCVQYDETTYDFLRRILAEEGLSYFFDHADADQGEKLVIVDDNGAFDDAPEAYPLRGVHGFVTSRESVRGLAISRGRAARRTEARAYNLTQDRMIVGERTPDQEKGGADSGSGGNGGRGGEIVVGGRAVTMYGYEGDAYRRDDAAVQARLALERSAAAATVGRGTGDVIAFRPGLMFEIEAEEGSPEGAMLLVSVRHRGANPERVAHGRQDERGDEQDKALPYQNEFTFVPARLPFRPLLLPKPVAVEDWALVVSAADDDPIYTDVHGRVRVRFGYDRDQAGPADRSSPWIPVAQAWAGDGFGVQIIPRAGMLVRLRYLYGDPDRPLVVGCLPTGHNVLPSPPPDEKTRLTIRTRALRHDGDSQGASALSHFNEISLDDRPEHELVFIRAGLDYRQKVLHDESVEIDHDEERSVGHDQKLHVEGARQKTVDQDETIRVQKKRTVTIAGDDQRHVKGNDTLTVEQDQTIVVQGARSTTVQGAESAAYAAGRQESVTGDDKLHVSANLTTVADQKWHAVQGPTNLVLENGDVTLEAGGTITLEVKGARLRMEPDGHAVLEADAEIKLLCGEASVVLSPDKVEIAAPQVQLSGANGAVTLDRSGATTTGLTVSSSAAGTNELTGAFVKAN